MKLGATPSFPAPKEENPLYYVFHYYTHTCQLLLLQFHLYKKDLDYKKHVGCSCIACFHSLRTEKGKFTQQTYLEEYRNLWEKTPGTILDKMIVLLESRGTGRGKSKEGNKLCKEILDTLKLKQKSISATSAKQASPNPNSNNSPDAKHDKGSAGKPTVDLKDLLVYFITDIYKKNFSLLNQTGTLARMIFFVGAQCLQAYLAEPLILTCETKAEEKMSASADQKPNLRLS